MAVRPIATLKAYLSKNWGNRAVLDFWDSFLASQAETLALTVNDKAVTPASLASGVSGSALAASAYRKVTVYSAGALTAGELLHISGYNAANSAVVVEKADADAGKPAQLIAAAANAGAVTSEARDIYTLTAQNTNAATVGDPVYLDTATGGGWTLSKPGGSSAVAQIVGRVTVKSATVGQILFDVARAEMAAIGSTELQPDSVDNAKLANITRGSVKVGGAADAPSDLDAKTAGQVVMGDGTDVKSLAISGDATLAGTGALTIAGSAVTGPKIASAAFLNWVVTGNNGAGACTLTGAKIGDKVLMNVNITDGTLALGDFEATITVVDQIQQSSAVDLSTKKFTVLLLVKS